MDKYTITVSGAASPALKEAVVNLLNQHNLEQGFRYNPEPLSVYAHDTNSRVAGALTGETNFGWLHIKLLAVDPSHRARGLGSRLLAAAELAAVQRGCRYAHLDTFSFQALPFYQKHGYEVFGQLDDYPAGCQRYFLRKTLVGDVV